MLGQQHCPVQWRSILQSIDPPSHYLSSLASFCSFKKAITLFSCPLLSLLSLSFYLFSFSLFSLSLSTHLSSPLSSNLSGSGLERPSSSSSRWSPVILFETGPVSILVRSSRCFDTLLKPQGRAQRPQGTARRGAGAGRRLETPRSKPTTQKRSSAQGMARSDAKR